MDQIRESGFSCGVQIISLGVHNELHLESGYDFRTVQELLGHKNVKTTMICTHVLNRGGMGGKSSVDNLQRRGEGVFDLPRV